LPVERLRVRRKVVRQDPALRIVAQLALDVARQFALVRLTGFREKRLEVPRNELVVPRGLELVPLVAFGGGEPRLSARAMPREDSGVNGELDEEDNKAPIPSLANGQDENCTVTSRT